MACNAADKIAELLKQEEKRYADMLLRRAPWDDDKAEHRGKVDAYSHCLEIVKACGQEEELVGAGASKPEYHDLFFNPDGSRKTKRKG